MGNIEQYIEHTLLKKNLKNGDIEKLCKEAIEHKFKAVCIFPEYLKIAKDFLKNKGPILVTVIDFPDGDKTPEEKEKEARSAIEMGAQEIDLVMDILALKDKNYSKVFDGISRVVKIDHNVLVKVIIETCYLNHDEKVIACALAQLAKARFVKTSTGFAKAGATIEDVLLLKKTIGKNMHVKASGGIKTLEEAMMFINAGASRIGTSAALKMLK